jgi:hypothetical protein
LPPTSFWSRNIKLASEKNDFQKRMCYFGYKVWSTHQDAKAFVNNHCNPHWKNKVLDKSGNSISAVFLGIRQHLWSIDMNIKAEKSIKERLKYIAKKKKVGEKLKSAIDISDTVSKDDLLTTETNKLLEKGFPTSYYPLQTIPETLYIKHTYIYIYIYIYICIILIKYYN